MVVLQRGLSLAISSQQVKSTLHLLGFAFSTSLKCFFWPLSSACLLSVRSSRSAWADVGLAYVPHGHSIWADFWWCWLQCWLSSVLVVCWCWSFHPVDVKDHLKTALVELLECIQWMATRSPGLKRIEESWDDNCFVYQELRIRADVVVSSNSHVCSLPKAVASHFRQCWISSWMSTVADRWLPR